MTLIQQIGCLLLLLAVAGCTDDGKFSPNPGPPSEGEGVAIGFNANASATPEETRASGGTGKLTPKARTTVFAYIGIPSATVPPSYTNSYEVKPLAGVSDSLAATGGMMRVNPATGYRFYALSTNSADLSVPVPGLAAGSNTRTAALRNGVDYLMAVNDNSGAGYEIKTNADPTFTLPFYHLCTQIVLNIKPADANGYTAATGLHVGIAPIDSTGSYIDLALKPGQGASTVRWGTDTKGALPLDQATGQYRPATKVEGGVTKGYTVTFILLPVASTQWGIPLRLDFTGFSFELGGAAPLARQSYTATLQLPRNGEVYFPLAGGTTYTYNVAITRNAITFTLPQVEPWIVDGVSIDDDEVQEVDPIP